MVGNFIGFILATSFAICMFYLVIDGFRKGRIHHSDTTSTYSLKKQPIKFFMVAVIFIALGSIFLYFAIQKALAVWHGL